MTAVTRTMQGLTGQVVLSHADIKALPTDSPITIVGAPGSNRVIIPELLILSLSPWVANYTNINGGAAIVVKLGTVDIKAGIASSGASPSVASLLALGESSFMIAGLLVTANQTDFKLADYGNKPLTFTVTNGGAGNFTGGDPESKLNIRVYYNIFKAA